MDTAVRNRQIKQVLSQAFGRDKISVRGSRGTGHGYVRVHIAYKPLDEDTRRDLEQKCKELLRAANVDLGKTFTDDTCQYTTDMCMIQFERPDYYRTMKHDDGSMSVMRDRYAGEWEHVPAPAA